MDDIVKMYIEEGKGEMKHAITHLGEELSKIRTGKASPAILKGLLVDYYGSTTPLTQVANVSTPDSKTLSIQPWEKSMLSVIEKAIFEANLGLTPMNDGEFIRINIPPLTEERRKELAKHAKNVGEEAKISLRNTRHKVMSEIKSEVKNGYPEDAGKRREDEVEKLVKHFTEIIDKDVEAKEKELMTM